MSYDPTEVPVWRDPFDLQQKRLVVPPPKQRYGHPKFYEFLTADMDLHDRKNRDYTSGETARPLGNFARVAALMSLYPKMNWGTPAGVALAYMLKQLDAVLHNLETPGYDLKVEGLLDRMADVTVYSGIVRCILSDEADARQDPAK